MFLLIVLTSCSTYKTLEIETFNPAAITFPRYVNTLMIINNAAQQPDSVGHKIEDFLNKTISISSDSTAYDLCLSLGESISEIRIFDDVRLCDDTMRRDSAFYEIRLFSKEEVRQICSNYGIDAFITLDKLIFNTNLTRRVENYGFYFGKGIDIEAFGELHVYWPGENDVYTFPFRDSLFWYDYTDDVSVYSRKDFNEAMRYLSSCLGEKLSINFIPYWSADKRWYYTSFFSEWKRASVFAAKRKWNEAEAIWDGLLPKTKNRKQQARLYSNLALCSEIKGDFNKAIEHAEKSCELYDSAVPGEEQFVKTQKLYIEILKKRLNNESLLSKQLREKL
jgi:tetratricopeptide (TPR) repeat protein